jgi:hypothetical protein
MNPIGMYIAIGEIQRDNREAAARRRRARFAPVDATPMTEPEHASRSERVAALVRRLGLRTAGA